MTVEQLLAGVDARLDKIETEIRATPRRGPVLLSDGRRLGHARRLRPAEWSRIRTDWATQYPTAEAKAEAEAA